MAFGTPSSDDPSTIIVSSSSVEDFKCEFLQAYYTTSFHSGGRPTRSSELHQHSSRRHVSQSTRLHSPSSRSDPAFSKGAAQRSESTSPLPVHGRSFRTLPNPESQSTPDPVPPKCTGALAGNLLPNSDSSFPQHITSDLPPRTRSTSGSGSDVASSSKPSSSRWRPHHNQGSSLHPRSSPTSHRKPSNAHMRSESTSDGSTAIPVDMKRLLSKPALPSSSPSSSPLFSDSESPFSSPSNRRIATPTPGSKNTQDPSRDQTARSSSRAQERPQVGEKRDRRLFSQGLESPSFPVKRHTEPSDSSRPEQKPPKPRTLLKRRPSANNGTRSPSLPSIPSHGASKDRIHSPDIPASPALAVPRSSRPAVPPKQESRSEYNPNAGSNCTLPSTLTPAGAVVEAYKQQEARREDLALTSQKSNDGHRGRQLTQVRPPSFGSDSEKNVTPYYTVLGSMTGKVVAAGGPDDDDDWSLKRETVYSTQERLRLPKSPSAPRNLHRKFSNKWRKAVWNPCDARGRDRSPSVSATTSDPANSSRPSLHELRFGSNGCDQRKSLRLSIEKFADLPLDTPLLHSMPTGRAGTWLDSPKSEQAEDKPGPRRVQSEMLSGGKIWKLMKRISSGGMREKYQRQDSTPPPVPAIPNIASESASQDGHGDNQPGVLSRFLQSRTSMSAAHVPHRKAVPALVAPRPLPASPIKEGALSDPSTGSPSPGTSDVGSSQVMHHTDSLQPSPSSNAEVPSTIPNRAIGKHIIPPSELYRLNVDQEIQPTLPTYRTFPPLPKSSDDWVIHSPEVVLASLPYPPRLKPRGGEQNISATQECPPSPIIPSFSITDPINTFSTRKTSQGAADAAGNRGRPLKSSTPQSSPGLSTTPPPRPPKSPKRALSIPHSARAPRDSSHGPAMRDDFERRSNARHRRKTSSDVQDYTQVAIPRQRSSSLETVARRGRKVTLTFREIGVTEKPTLTEQEKADKWDDLLARSARAGGTLHVGGDELISDLIRFSNISEIVFNPDGNDL